MGYATGLEVALKERDAEIERLRAWGARFEQSFYDTSSKAAEYREQIARLRTENLELRRLLVEVAETFAGVDPVGIDLRDRISEFVLVEPSHEN